MVPRERDLERESLDSEEERDRLREAFLPLDRPGILKMTTVRQGKKKQGRETKNVEKIIFLRATTETTRSREEKVKTSGVKAEGHHV